MSKQSVSYNNRIIRRTTTAYKHRSPAPWWTSLMLGYAPFPVLIPQGLRLLDEHLALTRGQLLPLPPEDG